MDEATYQEKLQNGEIKIVEEPKAPESATIPEGDLTLEQFRQYIPFLEQLKNVFQHIETAPTDTPQGFLNQIKFYLASNIYRVYVSINNIWKKIFDSVEYADLTDGGNTTLHTHLTEVEMVVVDFATDCATGDGKFYFHVGQKLAGMNLVYCHAKHITAGSGGSPTLVQLYNLTDSQDMLSTRIMVDVGETASEDATTPYVINTSYDDVAENDIIRIDVDQLPTTVPKGLVITLGFQK